ncbi:MAG: glycosyltransferase family 39 protein [Proteobacteria bacterium]|nr:glycosyltransferase family 39 protein [Pseudomonadota bacterium]MBU4382610.1 glycosyltransferase family 39 protein [Pseudomonadota bacterium]MBU4605737.1 glycosyltransferase family 39 protein [Pseudomonadota bacterium]MCG2765126.1 glycosyltransferase family 39 protein [Desulfarculaceae bacterium]
MRCPRALKNWRPRLPCTGMGLAAIVALGLGLRLWGLDWPHGLHPDEWAADIIASFAQGHWYYPHPVIWHQVFYLVAGFTYIPVQMLLGKLMVLLGPAYVQVPVISYLFWGRLWVALLGAANVWALYALVRALGLSRAAGLTAALLLAVNPLLVVHSHYLTVDAPLALSVTLALWAGVRLYQDPKWWRYLVAGLAFGLTLTTKANGGVILFAFVTAHLITVWERRPPWGRWLLAQPAVFVLGGVLGMITGYPGFLLAKDNPLFKYAEQVHNFTRPHFAEHISFWNSPLGDRLVWSAHTIGDAIGWELVVLFALGLALAIWRRYRAVWVVAAYPLFYYFPYLFLSHRLAERDLTSIVPPMICLAMLPLAWAVGRMPRWGKPALWAVAALALMIVPLGRSMAGAYLFWQEETRVSATRWAGADLPPSAHLYQGSYGTPKVPLATEFYHSQDPAKYQGEDNFVLVSSTDADRYFFQWDKIPRNSMGRLLDNFGKWQLIKEFDLGYHTAQDKLPGRFKYPVFVDPYLRFYAARPNLPQTQSLGLERPPSFAPAPYAVVYTNHRAYSGDGATALVNGPARAVRVLRPPRELLAVQVELVNLGKKAVDIKLVQGLHRRRLRLEPGQSESFIRQPQNWPLTVDRVYPFTLWVESPGRVFMRLTSDPLLLGLRCLDLKRWELAGRLLAQAQAARPTALLPRALGAAALLEQGRVQPAAPLLAGQSQALERLAALVLGSAPPDKRLVNLAAWAGLYPDLLANSLIRRYVPSEYEQGPERETKQEYPSFDFQAWAAKGSQGHRELLRLKEPLPSWPLRVRLSLSRRNVSYAPDQPLAVLTAVAQGPTGKDLTVRKELSPGDMGEGTRRRTLELELPAAASNQRWSFELRSLAGSTVHLDGVEAQVEVRPQLARLARWAFWAQGELMRRQGRPAPAAAMLAWVERLDPDFGPGLISQVQALEASGQPEAAERRLAKALADLPQGGELRAWAGAELKKLEAKGASAPSNLR